MTIDLAVMDDLLKKFKTPEEILGDNGLLKQLTKAVLQRALQAEMTHHLGHEKHAAVTNKNGNARNGSSAKTLKGDFGTMPIEIPRDRDGSFELLIIGKGQTRFAEFHSKISSLYSRGMITREIKGHLEEINGVEVSPTLISTVTEAVMEEVKIWQNRQLDALYPIVYIPNDEAIFKLLFLAMNNITKKWTQPIRDWKAAMGRFTILFEDRMPKP
jgi:putative transposase